MISRTAYDTLIDALERFETKPYAIMMGRRDWNELMADRRSRTRTASTPGDPDTFCGIPVRIEGRRMAKYSFAPKIFATPEDLHDELYEGNQRRRRRRH